jgi:IMP dehydrogenase
MSPRCLDPRWVGRTFSDFLFRPQQGVTESRGTISLRTRLSEGIPLELPIVSANMDSVTGAEMGKAMALEGGFGFIHRGQPIDKQAAAVERVKRSHGAVIDSPLCLPASATIREARAFARRHSITGILIETEEGSGVLAGLLSHRDIPWSQGTEDRPVAEFMTPVERLHTHPPQITPEEAEQILFDRRIERLPLVDSERRIHGLITRKDLLFLRQRPFASKDPKGRLRVGAAIGARGDFLERAQALTDAGVDCLVIDIAHGHSTVMESAIEAVRRSLPEIPLVCGNVATGEGARFLVERGASAIKVGVGPGRGCRTRLETAAGVPQLQAIRETWCAVEDAVPIIADGGIHHDKDMFLALVCGASTVMLGSALSGTEEAPGRVIEDPATHTKLKIYRGMTSPQAVLESLYDSEADVEEALSVPPEGQELQVPYKGSVIDILRRMRGHLQSAVSYAGTDSLAEARSTVVPDPFAFLIPLSEAARLESYQR